MRWGYFSGIESRFELGFTTRKAVPSPVRGLNIESFQDRVPVVVLAEPLERRAELFEFEEAPHP